MDNAFFSNRVNSWLKDRKEITELDTITMGSNQSSYFPDVEMFKIGSASSRTGHHFGQNGMNFIQNLAIVLTPGEIHSLSALFTGTF